MPDQARDKSLQPAPLPEPAPRAPGADSEYTSAFFGEHLVGLDPSDQLTGSQRCALSAFSSSLAFCLAPISYVVMNH